VRESPLKVERLLEQYLRGRLGPVFEGREIEPGYGPNPSGIGLHPSKPRCNKGFATPDED
jgi:hypothetical protein